MLTDDIRFDYKLFSFVYWKYSIISQNFADGYMTSVLIFKIFFYRLIFFD